MRFKNHITPLLFTIFTVALSGCIGSPSDPADNNAPLLPLSAQQSVVFLDDGSVKDAMRDYLAYKKAPLFSQYDFTRQDLNHDGMSDAIVYIKTPYGQWCDIHGCTLLILKALPQGFSILGHIPSVRPPFYVSTRQTAGWQDIGVYLSGKNEQAYTAILSFDGSAYTMRTDDDTYMLRQELIKHTLFP